MNRRFLPLAAAAALLAASVAGCTRFVNPATGEKRTLLISPRQEQQWGQEVYAAMEKSPGFAPPGSAEQQRLERVTRSLLAGGAGDPGWNYQIRVLKADAPNAFAAPGGCVFCTAGLLQMTGGNDDELAGVMAHELGHVAAKHTAFKMQEAMLWQGLGAAAAGAALAAKSERGAEAAAAVTGIVGNFVMLKHSRDEEYQADKLGIRYSFQAGYRPEGLVSFFRKLEKLESKSGGGGIPSFFNTHPSTPDRIKKVEEEIARTRGGS